jgi:photosystem II stability/assembly factor-like uncharacterized protein
MWGFAMLSVHKQHGYLSVVAAMLIVFVSMITLTSVYVVGTKTQSANELATSERAFYIAEAGLEYGIYQYKQDNNYSGTTNQSFAEGSFTITTSNQDFNNVTLPSGQVRLISAGSVGNTKRTTEVIIKLDDSRYGWAVGKPNSMAYHFTDSWDATTTDETERMRGVSCVANDDCWAVGDNGAMQHWNGSTWQSYSTITSETLEDVHCKSSDYCAAVGHDGVILIWDGSNWSALSTITSEHLNGVQVIDVNNIWSVGNNGVIIHTTSLGSSIIASPTAGDINGISCPLSNRCFAVGDAGAIIRYDGSNWTSLSSPTSERLYAISCAAENACQVATDNSFFVSFSGGAWTIRSGPFGMEHYRGIHCLTSSNCYAVGKKDFNENVISRWNGSQWLIQQTPYEEELYAVHFSPVQTIKPIIRVKWREVFA